MGIERESPGLVTEVAITVTVLPAGTVEGAVKVARPPLAVLAGVNEPQGTALVPHVADQLTPLFEGSPVTTTAMGAGAATCRAVGGWAFELKVRPMPAALMMMVAEPNLVLSVTEVAVTVTELFVAERRAGGAG